MGRKVKCPKCGEKFKVDRVDRKRVVSMLASGGRPSEIAEMMNVTKQRISQIAREAGYKRGMVKSA